MYTLEKSTADYLWYAENVRKRSTSTLKSRKRYLHQFLSYCNDNNIFDVEKITNLEIDMYHAGLSEEITQYGTKVSPVTINTGSIATIRAFFHWLLNVKRVNTLVIPSEIIDLKVPQKPMKVIVFSEVAKVVSECKDEQDALMIAVLFEGGLRIHELLDMHIEHLSGRKLNVIGKGQKLRITFISHELAEKLRNYWNKKGWNTGAAFRPLMHSNGDEGYKDPDTLRQRVQRCFIEVINMKMNPHLLRHAFALNLLENGCGLRSIQKLLGHSKIETTMRYLGVTDKFLEQEYEVNFGGSVFNM